MRAVLVQLTKCCRETLSPTPAPRLLTLSHETGAPFKSLWTAMTPVQSASHIQRPMPIIADSTVGLNDRFIATIRRFGTSRRFAKGRHDLLKILPGGITSNFLHPRFRTKGRACGHFVRKIHFLASWFKFKNPPNRAVVCNFYTKAHIFHDINTRLARLSSRRRYDMQVINRWRS